MKVSVSLPDDDVVFLDECVRNQGLGSRSAAVQKAIRMMRAAELVDAYTEAFDDWAGSDDADLWDAVTGDGMPVP
jgi:antitoxin MazE9